MTTERSSERAWPGRRVVFIILGLGAGFVAARAVPSAPFGALALPVRALVAGTAAGVAALVLDAIMKRWHRRAD